MIPALFLTACSAPDLSGGSFYANWDAEEVEAFDAAAAEICEVLPSECGKITLRNMIKTEGKGNNYGRAFNTGFANIYTDEIADRGQTWGPDLLRVTFIHESVHLLGCWEHLPTDLNGVMRSGPSESARHLTKNDVAHCCAQIESC